MCVCVRLQCDIEVTIIRTRADKLNIIDEQLISCLDALRKLTARLWVGCTIPYTHFCHLYFVCLFFWLLVKWILCQWDVRMLRWSRWFFDIVVLIQCFYWISQIFCFSLTTNELNIKRFRLTLNKQSGNTPTFFINV